MVSVYVKFVEATSSCNIVKWCNKKKTTVDLQEIIRIGIDNKVLD